MFLSDLVKKEIYSKNECKGVCLGVGVSLKTNAVKYLLCTCNKQSNSPDFALPISAVLSVADKIRLRSLRAVPPKSCVRFFPSLPVYTFDGRFLGKLTDIAIHENTVAKLFLDDLSLSPREILACADAVILRKEQAFPLGQRIPAPFQARFANKNETVITKSVLRAAKRQGALVKLTLSLPPFTRQ